MTAVELLLYFLAKTVCAITHIHYTVMEEGMFLTQKQQYNNVKVPSTKCKAQKVKNSALSFFY